MCNWWQARLNAYLYGSYLTNQSMSSGIFFNSMTSNIYAHVWNKYRPVILKLMIASTEEPQQYKFSSHEFKDVNPKEKGNYAFAFQAFQGKPVTSIKTSEMALGLMNVLQQSRKAIELMEKEKFEFAMDKQFVLTIKKEEVKKEEVVTTE